MKVGLLTSLEEQRRYLDQSAQIEGFDRYRQGALSLLTDPLVKQALDVTRAHGFEKSLLGGGPARNAATPPPSGG